MIRRQRPTINLCVFDNIMKEHAYLRFLYTSEGLVLKQNQENEKRRCRGQARQTMFSVIRSANIQMMMMMMMMNNGKAHPRRTDPDKTRSWLNFIAPC